MNIKKLFFFIIQWYFQFVEVNQPDVAVDENMIKVRFQKNYLVKLKSYLQ